VRLGCEVLDGLPVDHEVTHAERVDVVEGLLGPHQVGVEGVDALDDRLDGLEHHAVRLLVVALQHRRVVEGAELRHRASDRLEVAGLERVSEPDQVGPELGHRVDVQLDLVGEHASLLLRRCVTRDPSRAGVRGLARRRPRSDQKSKFAAFFRSTARNSALDW
jgi:hypothetical protein